jgi:hypothetical protein
MGWASSRRGRSGRKRGGKRRGSWGRAVGPGSRGGKVPKRGSSGGKGPAGG